MPNTDTTHHGHGSPLRNSRERRHAARRANTSGRATPAALTAMRTVAAATTKARA